MTRKPQILFTLILSLMIILGCPGQQEQETVIEQESRMLIIYYSLTGNTEYIAEQIQAITDAEIFKIELVEPYDIEYESVISRARSEREEGKLPELSKSIENLSEYDVIFLGTPNWFGTLSLPMISFLETHKITDQILIPFITHGRGGVQNTVSDLLKMCGNATFLQEFGVFGSEVHESLNEIEDWLERIGMRP